MAMLTTAWGWPWLVAAPVAARRAVLLGASSSWPSSGASPRRPACCSWSPPSACRSCSPPSPSSCPGRSGAAPSTTCRCRRPSRSAGRSARSSSAPRPLARHHRHPGAAASRWAVPAPQRAGLAIRAAPTARGRARSLGVPVKRLQTSCGRSPPCWRSSPSSCGPGCSRAPRYDAQLRRAAPVAGRAADRAAHQPGHDRDHAIALGVLEIGVGQNAESPDLIDPVLAVVIIVALVAPARQGTHPGRHRRLVVVAGGRGRPADPDALARLPVGAARPLRWARPARRLRPRPPALPVGRPQLQGLVADRFAVLGLSVVVLTGWSGQVSLGQMGFFAIGATVGAKATATGASTSPWPSPSPPRVGAVAAVVVGCPALRVRGIYLAVTTLAFSLAMTTYFAEPEVPRLGAPGPGPATAAVRADRHRLRAALLLRRPRPCWCCCSSGCAASATAAPGGPSSPCATTRRAPRRTR